MKRISVLVSEEVHAAAKYMAKSLGVTISSLGDDVFKVYGKHEAEIASKSLWILDNAEIAPESLKEAESMKKRLKTDMEPYLKLSDLYDQEEARQNEIVEAALEESEGNVLILKTPKRGGKK